MSIAIRNKEKEFRIIVSSRYVMFQMWQKEHLYRDFPIQEEVECGKCGESHTTKMNDTMAIMKDKAAGKLTRASLGTNNMQMRSLTIPTPNQSK